MDRASQEHALQRTIEEFLSAATRDSGPSGHTFDLPDDVLAAIVELESLRDDPGQP